MHADRHGQNVAGIYFGHSVSHYLLWSCGEPFRSPALLCQVYFSQTLKPPVSQRGSFAIIHSRDTYRLGFSKCLHCILYVHTYCCIADKIRIKGNTVGNEIDVIITPQPSALGGWTGSLAPLLPDAGPVGASGWLQRVIRPGGDRRHALRIRLVIVHITLLYNLIYLGRIHGFSPPLFFSSSFTLSQQESIHHGALQPLRQA